jgi:hypothetical protein
MDYAPIEEVKETRVLHSEDNQSGIDYVAIQRQLGLNYSITDLGYREKIFDTCEAGYGYSATKDCRKAYFAVIHFQLMCRDSEDTVSNVVTRSQMFPLSGRKVRWILKDQQGMIDLDSQGYGQISAVMAKSSSQQRIKLAVDNDFLYMRAGEITRVVTPRSWCNRF